MLQIKMLSNLQLWKRFKGEETPPAHIGASRDYNVDMVPKVRSFSNLLLLFVFLRFGTLLKIHYHCFIVQYIGLSILD